MRPALADAMVSSIATTNIAGKPLGSSSIRSSSLLGLEAHPICVEVCSTRGPAFFQLVGLAQAAVREARVRVASALARLGVLLDEYALTVNLAPADIRKSGSELDLALALGVLGAVGAVPTKCLERTLVLGELSLDGQLRAITGVLPQLHGAKERGLDTAIVPAANAREAGLARGMRVYVAENLDAVVSHLRGERSLLEAQRAPYLPTPVDGGQVDLADVRGLGPAKRALEIAAAGGHNLLMIGPPGSGKTMLARLLPTLMPPMTFDEALETTCVFSVAGLIDSERGMVDARPFRAPHHSVSTAGLIGGGEYPRPGEVSLAHHGVLFLDELAEFSRSALEALRQPLEDGYVHVVRAKARARFPARPVLVAAVNPCPCGYHGHPKRQCRCSPSHRDRYLGRLSGPLLDRIDLHIDVPPIDVASLTETGNGERSDVVRTRVQAARALQLERFHKGRTQHPLNASLSLRDLEAVAAPTRGARRVLEVSMERLGLSARAYLKVLRLARTFADLAQAPRVGREHMGEAIQGRLVDRRLVG